MTDDDLDQAEGLLGAALPEHLRRIYRAGDGRYRADGEWWVIWPLDRLVRDTLRAWREGTLDRALIAFGDDGTGNPFCAPRDGRDEVVRWSWIDSGVAGSEGALTDFLAAWATDTP